MLKISLKDGSIKEVEEGKLVIEVAKELSSSLAKKACVAKVDDVLVDLKTPLVKDCKLELILLEDKEAVDVLNHSCAHLLAHAMHRLYPDTCFGVGPAIEEGFYYDFKVNSPIALEDLPKIEAEMKKIVKENVSIQHYYLKKSEAKKKFASDKFKCELIDAVEDEEVGIYEQADYADVCRGPHVISTSVLKNFKLLNVSGAYWRGDSKNEMLTRIYGTCFATPEALEIHLHNLEERKKRDHRKLGKELDLFMLSEYGPGLPFWLPKGYQLRRTLEDFWLDLHKKRGYLTINTPIMLNRELWETSGHWDHYKDDMFTIDVEDGTYAIKPMNCPGAILVYKNDLHSYKELPLRYSELGNVHRYEASGALNGLFRVRGFTQDDAHIMLKEDQVGDEVARILSLYDYVYSIFGLDYSIELSTRPEENYIGEIEVWNEAEKALEEACLATGHSFKINPGDGAFYGPKLDFKLRDSMNRIWQCGTVQLDMQLPGRFNCTYISEDGSKKTPIMIHRACFGSLERFIGIITENYAGAFPTWLAPVQVKLIPVADAHKEYCLKLNEAFQKVGIRFENDFRDEKLGYKIREAQTKKIPYTLVIGDKELESNTVNYRPYGKQEQVSVSIDEFIDMILNHVKEKN
ncbi:MAG: threonine--tRNA ligase [Anaeroplasmataceae bacterium]|nr:threonine--tRNA ligase [Anaeroplasmataceae bacterium]MDE6414203.1 threonine--tRNA ligase [Anaeroplasmataceae bacterium]